MDGCPFGGLGRHEFAKFNDHYIYCQKCGRFSSLPDAPVNLTVSPNPWIYPWISPPTTTPYPWWQVPITWTSTTGNTIHYDTC